MYEKEWIWIFLCTHYFHFYAISSDLELLLLASPNILKFRHQKKTSLQYNGLHPSPSPLVKLDLHPLLSTLWILAISSGLKAQTPLISHRRKGPTKILLYSLLTSKHLDTSSSKKNFTSVPWTPSWNGKEWIWYWQSTQYFYLLQLWLVFNLTLLSPLSIQHHVDPPLHHWG